MILTYENFALSSGSFVLGCDLYFRRECGERVMSKKMKMPPKAKKKNWSQIKDPTER
jgi:hypothetical protein